MTTRFINLNFADGTQMKAWDSFSMSEDYLDPLGSYQFTVQPPRALLPEYTERLQRGELVAIQLTPGQKPIATPMIESVRRDVSRDGGIQFSITCRSVLAVTTEASADTAINKRFDADTPLADIIYEVMEPYNFNVIVADTAAHVAAVTGKPIDGRQKEVLVDALKTKESQVQEGETVYNFCAKLFSRLGVTLRVNWEGVLLIGRPDYEQQVSYTLVEQSENSGIGDRMLNFSYEQTNRGQFTDVIVKGKSAELKGKKVTAKPFTNVEAKARGTTLASLESADIKVQLSVKHSFTKAPKVTIQPEVANYQSRFQPYKPKYVLDKRSRDNERATAVGKMVLGKTMATANMLTCTVESLTSHSGRIWSIDTIARVWSPSLDIDQEMWIQSVSMKADRNGESATLKLIPKGALILGDIPK